MRGAATKAMSDIAEERQQRRYAPFAAAPLRAAPRSLGASSKVSILFLYRPLGLRGENRVAAWFFCYHFQHDWFEEMGSSGCPAPACGVGPGAETSGRLAD